MALDLTTGTSALKVRYLPEMQNIINNTIFLWSRIGEGKGVLSMSGKTWTIGLHTGVNTRAGSSRAAGDAMPTGGNQSYGEAVVPCTYIYSPIQINGQIIKATKDNEGSFIRAIASEIKGCVQDTKKQLNRQLFSDGRGALAFWTTADDATTVTVDDNYGNAFSYLPNGVAKTCDLIDVTNNATVLGDSIVVTQGARGATSYTVGFTGTVSGSADGDFLTTEDSIGHEITGLGGIISASDPPLLTGGLHGLTVASNAWWKAQVTGTLGSNVDLRFPLMQRVISDIEMGSIYTKADIKFILCNPYSQDKYAELCVNERIAVNTMKLDGGFEGLSYRGIPVVADADCPRNIYYFIVPDCLKQMSMSDFEWVEQSVGGTVLRVDPGGTDAYCGTLFRYLALACLNRPGLGALLGVSD